MLLMGYYSLDPLGKGFFRIDPAATLPPEALAFYSESQTFGAVASGATKLSKEVSERVAKEIAEEVAETVSKQVGETVSKNVAEQTAKNVMEQAYKNVQERAIAKNGKELAGGALLQALRKEAKQLSTETLETAAKKTGKEVAETAGEKTVKETAKETGENAVERVTKYGIKTGVLGGVGYALLSGPFGGFTEVIGNLGDEWTGDNCREKAETNYPDASPEELDAKVEACEAEAASKLTKLAGAVGLGLFALGALVVVRLVPKRKAPEPEPAEDTDEPEEDSE